MNNRKNALAYPILLALLCPFLSGCRQAPPKLAKASAPVTIFLASDLHYLSPALTDHGSLFIQMMEKGDGKLTGYCEEITDAFLSEAAARKPDAVILSGDLTFNGEQASHLDLAKKLRVLTEQGIPVLVIPGNHDVGYPYARSYMGEEAVPVRSITQAEFEDIYRDAGPGSALSKDRESLSCVCALAEDVRVLLLDVNTGGAFGSLLPSTLQWAEEQLKEAEEQGITVITVTHQNVMAHNAMFTRGFAIDNRKAVADLLRKYGVQLNLSGHMHVQHIAKEGGLYDAATGSLAVSPNRYAVITIDEKRSLTYETHSIDMASWAAAQENPTPELLNFAETSRTFFDECTGKKVMQQLDGLNLSAKQKEDMTSFAEEVNRLYFAGTLNERRESLLECSAWQLWKDAGKSDGLFFEQYLSGILTEDSADNNFLYLERQ